MVHLGAGDRVASGVALAMRSIGCCDHSATWMRSPRLAMYALLCAGVGVCSVRSETLIKGQRS